MSAKTAIARPEQPPKPPKSKKQSKTKAVNKASSDYARKKVNALFAGSNVVDKTDQFPKFTKNELVMGKLLGKGGFGTVMEIRGFNVAGVSAKQSGKKGQDAVAPGGIENKKFIAEHCLRNGGDARYAVKYLSPEVVADTAKFIQGMMDMAIEQRFLSSIEHPNIVKMRAMSTVDPYDGEFFIIMDRLYDTLEQRLVKWKGRKSRSSGLAGKFGDRKGAKAQSLMEDRLVAAFDLSSAIEYLHSNNIVYRDIKPDNIGFDCRGDIKVFDFGLSKEVTPNLAIGDGTFKLTGYTGSIRYMAPEIAREEPYNLTCDVYSFALLFWQILALEKPYSNYGISDIKARVHNGDSRPKVDPSWPVPLKLLLQKSWASDWKERYEFSNITQILRKEIVRIRSGDDSGLEHQRRRSTFVFRGNDRVGGDGGMAAAIAKANADWGVDLKDDGDDDSPPPAAAPAPKKVAAPAPKKVATSKKKPAMKRFTPAAEANGEFDC